MVDSEVWGFTIETTLSGRKNWPNELKREAVRRIREDESSLGDVAAEIGAHQCLVRKWWVADRRQRGEKITVEGPAFAELSVGNNFAVATKSSPPNDQAGFGRIRCGSIFIEFPLCISEADLVKLVRTAGEFQ